ncbi:hypothetical protein M885DRAFT_619658 [Pelagophyceae sp. CCMP2097]|nr:hypothetical protein M885DRAFT_619658 [Pelagophyceae sp. CCMP2097]
MAALGGMLAMKSVARCTRGGLCGWDGRSLPKRNGLAERGGLPAAKQDEDGGDGGCGAPAWLRSAAGPASGGAEAGAAASLRCRTAAALGPARPLGRRTPGAAAPEDRPIAPSIATCTRLERQPRARAAPRGARPHVEPPPSRVGTEAAVQQPPRRRTPPDGDARVSFDERDAPVDAPLWEIEEAGTFASV